MTIAQDNVHRFASADRGLVADQILNAACKRAAHLLSIGCHAAAEATLLRAGQSAHRILGASR